VNKRNLEAYLLRIYNHWLKMFGLVGTLERCYLNMALKYGLASILFYLLLWGAMLFDSWASFTSLNFKDSICTNFAIFAVLIVPVCALVAIPLTRYQVCKTGGDSFAYNGNIWKLAGCIAIFIVFVPRLYGRIFGIEYVPLTSPIIPLIACAVLLWVLTAQIFYGIHLMRKYCPYLADYVGGEVKRPGESAVDKD